MTNVITIRKNIRIGIDQVVDIEEFHLVVEFSVVKILEVDQGMNKVIGTTLRRGNCRVNVRTYQNQNFRRQNNRGGYRGNCRNENYERGRISFTERTYSCDMRRNDRSSSSRSRPGLRLSTNRDRVRHYKCR